MKLAITVDASEPFMHGTYCLEGDGRVIFNAYEGISVVYACISSRYYPNTKVVAGKLSSNPVGVQQMLAMLKHVFYPA